MKVVLASRGRVAVSKRSGKWRVKGALLRVVDSTGAAAAPDAAIEAVWTHAPAPGGGRAARPKAVKGRSWSRAARAAGGVEATSRRVRPGGALTLTVTSVVARGGGGYGCSWLRAAQDATTFTCDAAGCR